VVEGVAEIVDDEQVKRADMVYLLLHMGCYSTELVGRHSEMVATDDIPNWYLVDAGSLTSSVERRLP
jgi:hypothetical protein